MLKSIISVFISLTLAITSFGQCVIPTANFENWTVMPLDSVTTVDVPDGWLPLFSIFIYIFTGAPPGIEQSGDAQNGSSAARIYSEPSVNPAILGGDLLTFFACDEKNASLDGYYKFESTTGNDSAFIIFQATKFNSATMLTDSVGSGEMIFTGIQPAYKSFSIPLSYTEIPDTASIWVFYLSNDTVNPTSFKVDNLSFGIGTSTEELAPSPENYSIYPNPAASELVIDLDRYNLSSLKILNGQGQLVYFSDSALSGKIILNVSLFERGMYFVQFTDKNNRVYSRKFVKN